MSSDPYIHISLAEQRLRWIDAVGHVQFDVAVSTAANGAGEVVNSYCTPRGWHVVRARIGSNAPLNTVFIGRRSGAEIYTCELRTREPHRDWILTRILWLSGLEVGKNRLGNVDTMRRYIYIHGSPDDLQMGEVGSRGCVRMRNAEIVELFERTTLGTRVLISESAY